TTLYNEGDQVGVSTTNPSVTFEVNGSSTFKGTSTFEGRVGIGTEDPQARLDVSLSLGEDSSIGDATFSQENENPGVTWQDNNCPGGTCPIDAVLDGGSLSNGTYDYRVGVTLNDGTERTASESRSVTIGSNSNSATLYWEPAIGSIQSYEIYRKEDSQSDYTHIKSKDAPATSWTDNGGDSSGSDRQPVESGSVTNLTGLSEISAEIGSFSRRLSVGNYFEAPILFDSDNSIYYSNPSGKSNLNKVSSTKVYVGDDKGQSSPDSKFHVRGTSTFEGEAGNKLITLKLPGSGGATSTIKMNSQGQMVFATSTSPQHTLSSLISGGGGVTDFHMKRYTFSADGNFHAYLGKFDAYSNIQVQIQADGNCAADAGFVRMQGKWNGIPEITYKSFNNICGSNVHFYSLNGDDFSGGGGRGSIYLYAEYKAKNNQSNSLKFLVRSSSEITTRGPKPDFGSTDKVPVNGFRYKRGGKVGIGTSTTNHALDVDGIVEASNPGSAPRGSDIELGSPGGHPGMVIFKGKGANEVRWDTYVDSNSGDYVVAENTDQKNKRLVIERGGKVGIGTTNPQSKLHVRGGNTILEASNLNFKSAEAGAPSAIDTCSANDGDSDGSLDGDYTYVATYYTEYGGETSIELPPQVLCGVTNGTVTISLPSQDNIPDYVNEIKIYGADENLRDDPSATTNDFYFIAGKQNDSTYTPTYEHKDPINTNNSNPPKVDTTVTGLQLNGNTLVKFHEVEGGNPSVRVGIGIGSSLPKAGLEVASNMRVGSPSTGWGGQSVAQGNSSQSGKGYIETPWLYSQTIEASNERGNNSTGIAIGSSKTSSGQSVSEDQISLYTQGTSDLSVNKGDVGIGIMNPKANLHIFGGDWNFSNGGDLKVGDSANHFKMATARGGNGGGDLYLRTSSSDPQGGDIRISPGGDQKALFIEEDNDRIGIGTGAPSAKVELSGGGLEVNGEYGIGFRGEKTKPYGNSKNRGDKARMYYDGDFISNNGDYLVIEKTDANQDDPDGGIAFTNRGGDGARETSMRITGSGDLKDIDQIYAKRMIDRDNNNLDVNPSGVSHFQTLEVDRGSPTAILFDGGQARFTVHDGNGNFQLLQGADGSNGCTGSDSGVGEIEMGENGFIEFNTDNDCSDNTYDAHTKMKLESGSGGEVEVYDKTRFHGDVKMVNSNDIKMGTGNSDLNMNNNKIINVSSPTNGKDAVNKNFVSGAVDYKSCRIEDTSSNTGENSASCESNEVVVSYELNQCGQNPNAAFRGPQYNLSNGKPNEVSGTCWTSDYGGAEEVETDVDAVCCDLLQ
ncbi:MAG: hypothetical protein ABEI53_00575, partial [Candidatus Magasanikbacteria bacterium]